MSRPARPAPIYQGKVTVAKGADGSDSSQTAKALLLGDQSEADLKPELEIFADDVKCAHGAAVGDLDAESLFYLRARGHSGKPGAWLAAAGIPGRRHCGNRQHRPTRIGAHRAFDGAEGDRMTAQTKIALPFDAERARSDFEILARKVYGKPLVYLDSGASAQKPRIVLDTYARFLPKRVRQCPSRGALPLRLPPPTAMRRPDVRCRNSSCRARG
jgi:hypothetical protein